MHKEIALDNTNEGIDQSLGVSIIDKFDEQRPRFCWVDSNFTDQSEFRYFSN